MVEFQKVLNDRRLKDIGRQDAFCMLRNHVWDADQIIGCDGARAFTAISKRALSEDAHLQHRITHGQIDTAVRHQFCELIFRKREQLNDESASFVVAEALEYVRREGLICRKFHFPTILPTFDQISTSFSVGPVKFVRSDDFLGAVEGMLESERISLRARLKKAYLNPSPLQPVFGPKFESKWPVREVEQLASEQKSLFEKHFSQGSWVATILVRDFGRDVASGLAEECVVFALNLLRVMSPDPWDRGLRLVDAFTNNPEIFRVSSDENLGSLDFSKQFGGDVTWESEDFSKMIVQPEPNWLTYAGSLLARYSQDNQLLPVGKRFFSAVSWYGEGINMRRPDLAIVAYVNALESLFTIPRVRISKHLRQSVEILMKHERPEADWSTKVKRLYDDRSNIVHGRSSLGVDKVEASVGAAKSLVRSVLLEALWWAFYSAKRSDMRTPKEFENNMEDSLLSYRNSWTPSDSE